MAEIVRAAISGVAPSSGYTRTEISAGLYAEGVNGPGYIRFALYGDAVPHGDLGRAEIAGGTYASYWGAPPEPPDIEVSSVGAGVTSVVLLAPVYIAVSSVGAGVTSVSLWVQPQPLTGVAGIPSAEAFGSGGKVIQQLVGVAGIESEEAFGTTGIVLDSATSIKVYIGGVDRSDWVMEGSIRPSMQIGSRATAGFSIANGTETIYRPQIDDEVVIYYHTTRIFAGTVESTEERSYWGHLPVIIDVRCTDYGVLCDRRIVGFDYTLFWGNTAHILVGNMARRFLCGTGISYVPPTDMASPVYTTPIGEQVFNYVPASAVLTQVCNQINCDWRVDFWKNLYLFSKTDGYGPAPFALTDTNRMFSEIKVTRTRGQYRNKQWVVNSRAMRATWKDSFPADFPWFGWNIAPTDSLPALPTTYNIPAKPLILVNAVEKVVIASTEIGTTLLDWDFYYFLNSAGVWANPSKTLPVGADIIGIWYPSPLPPAISVQDDTEIALRGLIEAAEDAKDLATITACEELAAGLLARGKEIPVSGAIRTLQSGLEPGQLLTVNTTKPLCNETLLIEAVDGEEIGKTAFWWTAKGSNTQLQRSGSGTQMWQRIIHKLSQPADRVKQVIRITLAETIQGQTNPGLVTGVGTAIATVQATGIVRDIRLRWRSVDLGTPTTLPIELDVYLNGLTIFDLGAEKILFPAAAAGQVVQWRFSEDPLVVAIGDVFTIEVLQADPVAMDGILEITVMG